MNNHIEESKKSEPCDACVGGVWNMETMELCTKCKGTAEMAVEESKCQLCGEPMPKGEEMFNYHGYSGDCPKPPLELKDKCECYCHKKGAHCCDEGRGACALCGEQSEWSIRNATPPKEEKYADGYVCDMKVNHVHPCKHCGDFICLNMIDGKCLGKSPQKESGERADSFEGKLETMLGHCFAEVEVVTLIQSLVSQTLEAERTRIREGVERMKKLSKISIPDNDGTLSAACDRRDIPYIIMHYQHTLLDTHNAALEQILSTLLKKE